MIKSASFGVMHLGIAFTVAYALTGSVAIAGAITFVEPLVNTVAHYFFDRGWAHPRAVAWRCRHGLETPAVHGAVEPLDGAWADDVPERPPQGARARPRSLNVGPAAPTMAA